MDARLRVPDGSFQRGEEPRPRGGPDVLAAYLTRSFIRVGEQDKSFSGTLDAGAVGVAMRLEGDVGTWTVSAAPPLPEAPEKPSFNARLSFASEVPLGPALLSLWAVDEQGRHGEPFAVDFNFTEQASPEQALVVTLRWDTPSDLDLHVALPDGVEVSKDNVSSAVPPAPSGADAGRLMLDSNAECVIDGRNEETFVWELTPMSGHYVVRVDAFSLCESEVARWTVEAWLRGKRVGTAEGVISRAATRSGHGHGAGVLALEFDVEAL